MEYEDLLTWLQRRRKDVSAPTPVVVNIELGDLLAKLISQRGNEVNVRERVVPYPS